MFASFADALPGRISRIPYQAGPDLRHGNPEPARPCARHPLFRARRGAAIRRPAGSASGAGAGVRISS